MARHKDIQWSVSNPVTTTEQAILCVLMDIRDELQAANTRLLPLKRLDCSETLSIPRILRRISANTYKQRRRRKVARQ